MKNCIYPDCPYPVWAKNLCNGHYLQAWKNQELRPLRKRVSDAESLMEQVDKQAECWLWTGATTNSGYGLVKGYKLAHRVAYTLFNGPIPHGQQIRHQCHVRRCVNPDHLLVGTAKDNAADALRDNRTQTGERNPQAKLTVEQVKEIYLNRTDTLTAISQAYGISTATASMIRSGKRWSSITNALE